MKKPLLLALSFFSFIPLFAQYELDNNNIKARNEQNGILFNNSMTFSGGFEAPINSGLNTFYAFGFWVAGIYDTIPYAHGARYLQLSDPDLRFGPMMDPEYYDTENEIWDRVWNISKAQIENHILNYNEAGYVMPEVIENWPAHGDVSKGQAFYLAPFVDLNNDGLYNPELGEYPRILGDQAIYSIYNGERSNELMTPMGIETHIMLYTYEGDEMLDQTVFAYVKHYNRSPYTYINAYLGMFSDFDLGNFSDDASFTDVDRSTLYATNGDGFDEDGYESDLPYQSTTILRGVKQDNDEIDNAFGIAAYESANGSGYGDDIIDNEYRGLDFSLNVSNNTSVTGDPQTAAEYYNTLSGRWSDGTNVVYGGNGYDSDSESILSRYTQSSNDPNLFGTYGQEATAEWDAQVPADTRMIGSSGPFIFFSGSCRDMYTAFVFERPGTGSQSEDLAVFNASIDYVKENFETIEGEQCSEIISSIIKINANENQSLAVYPNPFTDHILFSYEGNDINARVFIYDLLGHEQFQSSVQNGSNDLNPDKLEGNAFIIKLVDQDGIYTQKIMRK